MKKMFLLCGGCFEKRYVFKRKRERKKKEEKKKKRKREKEKKRKEEKKKGKRPLIPIFSLFFFVSLSLSLFPSSPALPPKKDFFSLFLRKMPAFVGHFFMNKRGRK